MRLLVCEDYREYAQVKGEEPGVDEVGSAELKQMYPMQRQIVILS